MIKRTKSRRKIKYVLNHLRSADIEEIKAVHGDKWFPKLFKNIMKKDVNVIVGVSADSKKPVAIFGIKPDTDNPQCAIIWLLSTSEIENKKFAFLKKAKQELELIEKKYSFLYNFIHVQNTKMLRMLKKLGFKTLEYNLDNNPEFKFFYKRIYLSGVSI